MSTADPTLLHYAAGLLAALVVYTVAAAAFDRWRWGPAIVPAIAAGLAVYNLLR